jgi:methionyl-tRNA synthetase
MKIAYHTTPIYYVNDVPHVGHAYTTVASDALSRARRLMGQEVFFLTGTDEHGQNIERIAREKGLPAQEYCDRIAAVFRELWTKLDVRYDRFIRTTDALHKRGVVKFWGRLRIATAPSGEPAIYRGKYAGWYCPRCEDFKTEDELRQPGNVCPDHERACEWTEEENFFFRLSAYAEWLRAEIESERLLIEPLGRRNEVLAVIRDGLQDVSVSRARVKWGIPVPEQPDHVFYVWMDALANYITALGYDEDAPEYRRYWDGAGERLHFVGKEIIRFHCLLWPAMLKAAELPVPTRVFAHGHLTKDGKKLSKTTGNVIDPDALIRQLGPDAFRYFFLREGSFGQDWDFTQGAYVVRYNADLANDFGNLVSRALTMVARYCDGKVPARPRPFTEGSLGIEEQFSNVSIRDSLVEKLFAKYEALDFSGVLGQIWEWIGELNQRIVTFAPWEAAKDPGRKAELDAFLYGLIETVRLLAVFVSPVIPGTTSRVFAMLGLAARDPQPADLAWGVLEPGSALGELKPLFPRVEKSGSAQQERPRKEERVAEEKPGGAPAAPSSAPVAAAPSERIDVSDFARVELRVAQVTAAEKVAGSKKLLKLQVDLGAETRQLVAGIAESYAPEALVGKQVAVVANLKPAKLMGVESNGMVLAASPEGRAVLLTLDGDVPPGTKIK